MNFSHVIFYSKDAASLSSFISELLDTEIDYKDESIFHSSDLLNFEIRDAVVKSKKAAVSHGQRLKFVLDDLSELASLKQKIEFFCYRQKLNQNDLVIDEDSTYLLIKDPDGREWDFSVI
jgi:hypothetical protein